MDSNNRVVSIFLAGGKGTRLWPLSTPEKPKPFISIDKKATILNGAIKSVQPFIDIQDTYIVLDKEYEGLLYGTYPDFPKNNIILEPFGRNTAAAAGLATIMISNQLGPDTVCIVLAVDHVITSHHERFLEALRLAASVAKSDDVLVDIGVIPLRPDTKYGYLNVGEKILLDDHQFLRVYDKAKFTEKPNNETARQYFIDGDHLWNTAIFAWKCSTFIGALSKHMPDLYSILNNIQKSLGTNQEWQAIEEAYRKINNPISLDYGIMDNASNIKAVAANFGWTEIGSWVSLETIMDVDQHGNLIVSKHNGIDTQNCIVYSDSELPIYTLGVSDLIIVEANGRILVCNKNRLDQLNKLANLE